MGRIGVDKSIAFALQRDLMRSGVKIMFDAEVEQVKEASEDGGGRGLGLAIKRSSNQQPLCEIESDALMTGPCDCVWLRVCACA